MFGVGCWLFDVPGGGLIVFLESSSSRNPNAAGEMGGLVAPKRSEDGWELFS